MKVRLYVEGGPVGADAEGARRFRAAFKQHFERLDPRLKTLELVARGSTDQTIRSYAEAVRQNSGDRSVALLVDSDAPVTAHTSANHLAAKLDSAHVPQDARTNVFLMVQCMEAWLVCDNAALEKCYGARVKTIQLPPNPDVEAVSPNAIRTALDRAARNTSTGHYHKVRDAVKILRELKPELVALRSRHAQQLHAFLRRELAS